MEEPSLYSVPVTLQRVTKESLQISVPLTEELSKTNDDGTVGIDTEKLFKKAIEIGQEMHDGWGMVETLIEISPIQGSDHL